MFSRDYIRKFNYHNIDSLKSNRQIHTVGPLLSHGATRLVGKEDKTTLVIVFRKYFARVLEKSIARLGNGRSGNAMHYRRCVVVVAGTARKG